VPKEGDPTQGVEPGTEFEKLPLDYVCPGCRHPDSKFVEEQPIEVESQGKETVA